MIENIWEGVYSDFKEVPVSGPGFNGGKWATNSLKKISELLEAAKKQGTIPSVVAYRANLLPLLAALVREETGRVSVLDFGGGLGFTYVPVAHALVEKSRLDYHIVDVERICESGTQLFENDDCVHFHTSLPSISEVDIVHMGSSLQYIRDWKELINRLADYQSEYFLFTDLMAGDIPTYATAQNYYGSKIPHWFFNINEIIATMSSVGFDLLFKSTYTATILGKEQELPQNNFPEDLRLGRACSLLFAKRRHNRSGGGCGYD